MKKIAYSVLLLALAGISHSAPVDINYPSLNIPHNQEINFDLKQGESGMKPQVAYHLVCNLTSNNKTKMFLRRGGALIYMGTVLLDGKNLQNFDNIQFEINPVSVLELQHMFISGAEPGPVNGPNPSSLFITNLDKDNDVQMNCSATPE